MDELNREDFFFVLSEKVQSYGKERIFKLLKDNGYPEDALIPLDYGVQVEALLEGTDQLVLVAEQEPTQLTGTPTEQTQQIVQAHSNQIQVLAQKLNMPVEAIIPLFVERLKTSSKLAVLLNEAGKSNFYKALEKGSQQFNAELRTLVQHEKKTYAQLDSSFLDELTEAVVAQQEQVLNVQQLKFEVGESDFKQTLLDKLNQYLLDNPSE